MQFTLPHPSFHGSPSRGFAARTDAIDGAAYTVCRVGEAMGDVNCADPPGPPEWWSRC